MSVETNEKKRNILLAVVALRSRRTCHAPTGLGPVAAGRGWDAAVGGGVGRGAGARRPPLVPGFVVLFLVAVAVRTSGVLSATQVAGLQEVETIAIGMGLVGLGSQVRIARLRQVGGRPLVLGLASWVLVGGVSLLAVTLVG